MSDDNPFRSSDAMGGLGMGANEEGDLPPVDLDVMPILERCWQLVTANLGVVVAAIAFQVVPSMGIGFLQSGLQMAMENAEPELAMLLGGAYLGTLLVNFLLSVFVTLGSARVFSRIARGLPADISMLFGEGRRYFQGLVAMLLYTILFVLGSLLFVIPGVIAWVGLQFWMYALVDQDLHAIDALKESWRLTDGYKVTIFLTDLAIFVVALVVTCATCGLGYLVLLPLLLLSSAVIYHSLTHLQGTARNAPGPL